MSSSLLDKQILIVGGSSGIGLATARAALAASARVILASRSEAKLTAARTTLAADAHDAHIAIVVADDTSERDVQRLCAESGPLDHILATAAEVAYEPIASFALTSARRLVDSKLLGPLLLAKHGGTRLRPGGSLTFTSGIASERPAPRGAMVAVVNGALESLARALAIELAPLRVNAVSPGWVDTPIWDAIVGVEKSKILTERAARLPVRHIGQPADMPKPSSFL